MKKKPENLRGRQALVTFDSKPCHVTIVTHIRGDVWLVDGRDLPQRFERYHGCRRTTVKAEALTLLADDMARQGPPRQIRRARTPVEMMIDRACGL